MANQAITSGSTSLGSAGLNSILTFFLAGFRSQKRQVGRPINYCNSDASALLAEEGGTATIPLYPTTTSSLTTDGAAVVQDDSVGTSVSVTLNKNRTAKFSLTEVARALDGDKVNSGLMMGRVDGFLNDVETDVMSVATTSFSTNTVGTYNSAITEANIVAAMVNYWGQLAPGGVLPVALVRPDANAWGACLQLAAFRDYQVTGQVSPTTNDYMNSGLVRYGANWVVTQAMPKNGTSIDNLIFHPNAVCVAMRQLKTPIAPGVQAMYEVIDGISFRLLLQWNGDRLADEFVLQALYGYGPGKEQWGVQFKS